MPLSDRIFDDTYKDRQSRPTLIRTALLIVLTIGTIFGLFVIGEFVQRTVTYTDARKAEPDAKPYSASGTVVDMALNTIPEFPLGFLRNSLVDSGLTVYDLRISRNNLKYLQDTAEKVTALSGSFDVPREYVSADFRIGNEWIPIKVKLRGQFAPHYHKRAASLRLNFPKERLLDGKEQVNISFLYDKGLTSDITTNWELQRHGILTWDSQFIVLRINGEVIGVFQEIEQFGRSIWDRNRRSEGFIFAGHGQLFGDVGLGHSKATDALELLMPCDIPRGETVPRHCDWAFFNEYFDIDKWAWAAAMTMLLNSTHAWNAENMRIYWDPARGAFEPIPWDYLYYRLDPEIHVEGEQPLWEYRASLFDVAEFRRLRDQRLWTLITTRVEPMIEQANGLFEKLSKPLTYDLRHFGLETDREMHKDYIRTLRNNASLLKSLFQEHDVIVTVWPGANGVHTLEIRNFGKAFLEVRSFQFSANGEDQNVHPETKTLVDGFWQGQPGTIVVNVQTPAGMQLSGMLIGNEVTGATVSETSITIQPGNEPVPEPAALPETESFLVDVDGVQVNGDSVIFGPGDVALTHSLTVPDNYRVVFNPGLNLLIGDGASLVIHGDLYSVGTERQPIQITGLHSPDAFGGVFVQGTRTNPSRVDIKHLRVIGGRGGESKRSFFTSPFSVHDGTVTMQSSEFYDSSADDGINLKYSEVDVRDILVQRSLSDAVDCDFCSGILENNRIFDSGGDGLDFSGSDVRVTRNTIERCADKGISIGEETTATVTDINVNNCYIGLAVKDTSSATITGGQLQNLQVGIAMYIKKPTFGPGDATLQNLTMTNVETRYLHDGISKLNIIDPDETDQKIASSDNSRNISITNTRRK
jgi:hypothetical protein